MDECYPDLREFPIHPGLLASIPTQAQRGLSTFDVHFTCIDVAQNYVAIGSTVGVAYLYDRTKARLQRLRTGDYRDGVTSVRILLSLECLVAFGCQSGLLIVFKVPFRQEHELEKFVIEGVHRSAVTALEWAPNGLKLFSGDKNGSVVCNEIDHMDHQSRSRVLCEESCEVVQLSYCRMHLIVSTLWRSFVHDCSTNTVAQIGQKNRKSPGRFGAVFFDSNNKTLYASRPGQRLWKSGVSGIVLETLIFKDALAEAGGIQFGHLSPFNDCFLLTWSPSCVLVIDPLREAVIISRHFSLPIVDVVCCRDEILILQGNRHLVRIATTADSYLVADEANPPLIDEILAPLKSTPPPAKERSKSECLMQEESIPRSASSSSLFGWLKKQRAGTMPVVIPDDDSLPGVVKLDADDVIPVQLEQVTLSETRPPQDDDIVFRPKRKKKKVKVRLQKDVCRNEAENASGSETDARVAAQQPSASSSDENVPNLNATASELDHLNANLVEDESDNTNHAEVQLENVLNLYLKSSHSDEVDAPEKKQKLEDETSEEVANHRVNLEMDLSSEVPGHRAHTEVDPPTEEVLSRQEYPEAKAENDPEEVRHPDDIYSLTAEVIPTSPSADDNNNNNDEMSESLEVATIDRPKYGVEWLQYRAPEILSHLSVSDGHLFCVDIHHRAYAAHFPVLGLDWTELSQPAEKLWCSASEAVCWALYKGTAYAAVHRGKALWIDVEWMSVARDVCCVAVDDTSAWYVTNNGYLVTQQGLSASKPFGYPEMVSSPPYVTQVACRDGVVWILTADGKLLCRSDSSAKKQWKNITPRVVSEISGIALGGYHTGWIADSEGILWFLIGVTAATPEGIGRPWQVESGQPLYRSSKSFHSTLLQAVSGGEALLRFLRGKQQICPAISEAGVWFCKTFDNLVFCSRKNIIGHQWDVVVPPSTARSTQWKLLSVKGILSNQDLVWCVDGNGDLFCLCGPSRTPLSVESLPGDIVCLEPGALCLWVLMRDGCIHMRRGITPSCMQGTWWDRLDLAQIGEERLTHISCSEDIVWACSTTGKVLVRIGSLRPSSRKSLSQAWITLDYNEPCAPALEKVYAGPGGRLVWALDGRGEVYVREGVTERLPVGRAWTPVPELQAASLCVSRRAVWLLEASGHLHRRFGMSERNPCGDYWKRMPGAAQHLSVTEEDDIWGLRNDAILQHASFTLDFPRKTLRKISPTPEDDWEHVSDGEPL